MTTPDHAQGWNALTYTFRDSDGYIRCTQCGKFFEPGEKLALLKVSEGEYHWCHKEKCN